MMIFTTEFKDQDGSMKWIASVSDYNRNRGGGAIRATREEAIQAAKEAIADVSTLKR